MGVLAKASSFLVCATLSVALNLVGECGFSLVQLHVGSLSNASSNANKLRRSRDSGMRQLPNDFSDADTPVDDASGIDEELLPMSTVQRFNFEQRDADASGLVEDAVGEADSLSAMIVEGPMPQEKDEQPHEHVSVAAARSVGEAASLPSAGSKGTVSINATKPHIVFVLADDLGWNGVGYNGITLDGYNFSKVSTPTLNKLSADGVRMGMHYTGPYCAVSRFAFLTGRASWRSEAGYMNFSPVSAIGTNLSYTMLPAALRKVGYVTHLVGKWHQGYHMDEYLPSKRGFDTSYGILDACTQHYTQQLLHDMPFKCRPNGNILVDMMEDGVPALSYPAGEFSDTMYRNRAVEIIRAHDQSKPMFLLLALQLPHEPFEVPDEYSSKYSLSADENIYWGMHSHVDDTVLQVVEALEATNMYTNTVIVVTSDNGAPKEKYEEPYLANFPLRGHKGQLYDGGIRVPCFVSGGFLPTSARGRTLTGLMVINDWYATLGHLAGAAPDNHGPAYHDSYNNWKYIIGARSRSSRTDMVQHYMGRNEDGSGERMSVYRYEQFKAVVFGKNCSPYCVGQRDCTPAHPCVYDVEKDPGETTDVSSSYPEMVTAMINHMDSTWEEAIAQPFFALAPDDLDDRILAKACNVWSSQSGYLVPWATEQDELEFASRRMVLFKSGESF